MLHIIYQEVRKKIKRLKMKYPIYALGQVGIASVSKVDKVGKVWTSLLRLLAPWPGLRWMNGLKIVKSKTFQKGREKIQYETRNLFELAAPPPRLKIFTGSLLLKLFF